MDNYELKGYERYRIIFKFKNCKLLLFFVISLLGCSPNSLDTDTNPIFGTWINEESSGNEILIMEHHKFTRKMTGNIAHLNRVDTVISSGEWSQIYDSLKIVYDGTTDTFTTFYKVYSNGNWNEDALELFDKIFERRIE